MNNNKYSRIFIPRAGFYLWVIFILIIVIGILEWKVAIPGLILLSFLVFYNYKSNHIRQREITKYIENLNFNIDTATRDTLINFPMPLVVAELDGTIIWYNSSFRQILDGEELLEKTISSFVEGIRPENPGEGATNISREISVNGRHFNVLGNFVELDEKSDADKYILLLYFVDITDYVEITRRYNNEKLITGTIVIDNYDDLMQSMEDVNRPQMLAEIERALTGWMSFSGGILKKFERDKYIFLFENRHFKEFEDKKFDILDIVKEINVGNKIPVTLSIGLGMNGETLIESFRFASASLDIALGRGGDQVVIKDRDKFSFYGGKTRELEKKTKVKARVIAYALRGLIDQSPDILIMGHENGDLDSLGASLGIYRIAMNRGKSAHIVLNSSNPAIDHLIEKINRDEEYNDLFISCSEAMSAISRKTLLIVLDTHRPGFTECPELLEYTDQVVVLDHHRKGTDFIRDAVLVYQETYASSTCELVSEILQYVEEKMQLKGIEAEALYAGMIVDTKNFTFKTGVRTFEAAAFLRRQGVDTISVKQLFQNDLGAYVSRSNVVRAAEIIENNIAISACPPEMKNAQLIAAQAADELISLSGVMAAFVLSTDNNTVSISGRSLGDINVQLILEKLGGGGHLTVAGAQLQDISIADAKEKLKCAIIDYKQKDGTTS